jgi:hypothetical protein
MHISACPQARRGRDVFVCDTEQGRVLQIPLEALEAGRMSVMREVAGRFGRQSHINTVAPLAPDLLLVIAHNLGQVGHTTVQHAPVDRVVVGLSC